MASKDEIDLLAPFRNMEKDAKRAKGIASVQVKVKNRLVLDLKEVKDAPHTLAQVLLERIQGEVRSTNIPVKQATIDRRRRALQNPQQGRYPSGYRPNPSGSYGHDSGYLIDSMKVNKATKGDAFVGIPKNRQKAAFVLRRMSETVRKPAKAVREGLESLLKKMVKKK